jgi:hypothetical protein
VPLPVPLLVPLLLPVVAPLPLELPLLVPLLAPLPASCVPVPLSSPLHPIATAPKIAANAETPESHRAERIVMSPFYVQLILACTVREARSGGETGG